MFRKKRSSPTSLVPLAPREYHETEEYGEEENEDEQEQEDEQEEQLQNQKNPFSFRPRRPLVNPMNEAHDREKKRMQLIQEAKEHYTTLS